MFHGDKAHRSSGRNKIEKYFESSLKLIISSNNCITIGDCDALMESFHQNRGESKFIRVPALVRDLRSLVEKAFIPGLYDDQFFRKAKVTPF